MADIAPNKSLFIGQYFSTLILPASLARSFFIVRSLLCIVEWVKHLWLLCTSANSIPLSCDNQNPQFSLVAQSYLIFVTQLTAACQASLSITNTWSLLKLVSIELVTRSNHLILHHSLLEPPSIFPSIRVFFNESVHHMKWPKYWSFSFSISPSNKYSGLMSCRMDWMDFFAVQGTLKSLLQHHSSKASLFWH